MRPQFFFINTLIFNRKLSIICARNQYCHVIAVAKLKTQNKQCSFHFCKIFRLNQWKGSIRIAFFLKSSKNFDYDNKLNQQKGLTRMAFWWNQTRNSIFQNRFYQNVILVGSSCWFHQNTFLTIDDIIQRILRKTKLLISFILLFYFAITITWHC